MGGSREDRAAAVREHVARLRRDAPGALWNVEIDTAPSWPFCRQITPESDTPAGPGVVWIRDLHLAFPSGQRAGTRLVLTQSTYQMQRWLDWLDTVPAVHLVADGSLGALVHSSPEVQTRRGPWCRIDIREVASQAGGGELTPDGALHAAFRQSDPERRFEVCRRAVDASPDDPAMHLAFASACMERQLLDDAHAALHRAASLDAGWEATHFELGKLWLRLEDTERAAGAFAEAARLMPRFAVAWLNLGGALGELGRPAEALTALHRALEHDPRSHTILNNIGTVHRDEGRLDEAERAYRQVIALAPAFVFGYYNLAHTLFLEGRFDAARQMYEEGFARDAQKNPRQAVRLAVARAADGDADGALQLLEEVAGGLPAERTRELLEEAESTLSALSAITGVDAAAIARVRAAVGRYSS